MIIDGLELHLYMHEFYGQHPLWPGLSFSNNPLHPTFIGNIIAIKLNETSEEDLETITHETLTDEDIECVRQFIVWKDAETARSHRQQKVAADRAT